MLTFGRLILDKLGVFLGTGGTGSMLISGSLEIDRAGLDLIVSRDGFCSRNLVILFTFLRTFEP